MMLDKSVTEKKTVTAETAIAVMDDFVIIAAEARKYFQNIVQHEEAAISSRKTAFSFEYAEKKTFGILRCAVSDYHSLGKEIQKAENRPLIVSAVKSFFGQDARDMKDLADKKYQRENLNKIIRSSANGGYSPLTNYMAICVAGKIEPEKLLNDEYERRISDKCPENERMADVKDLDSIEKHRSTVNSIGYGMRNVQNAYIEASETVISRSKTGISNVEDMISSVSSIKSALIAGNEEIVRPVLAALASDVFVPRYYNHNILAAPDDMISVTDKEGNTTEKRFSSWLAEDAKENCDYHRMFVSGFNGTVASLHEISKIPAKMREASVSANISGHAPK